MANYIFEQMTDAQAAAYDPADDNLFFLTGDPSTVQVTVNPASGLNLASLTLTNSGVTHTFGADALGGEVLTFFGESSDDTLAFGHDSTADTVTVVGVADAGARYYALGGADVITGSAASDTIYGGEGNDTIAGSSSTNTEADYLNGGGGADSIVGGSGNDHIWGNEQTTTAGSVDGADIISAGAGKDYVQGNAGADLISGGADNDRLYGGADNDTITGDDGQDWLQGNKGADSLDGGNGNDTIHGGADNDVLLGSAGDDQLFGDLGNDTLTGGAGFDTLTGGDGADSFTFGAADSLTTNVTTAATAANHDVVDVIWDFTHGTDHLTLAGTTGGAVSSSATNFASLQDAMTFAQTHITGNVHDVEALQVGSDTALFWSGTANGTVDSVVLLHGVTASTITNADFVF